MNKTVALSLLPALLLLSQPAWTQQAQAKSASPQILVERTFWVKPGKERQFAALFERTQLPRLKTLLSEHLITGFSTASPLLHTSNEQWAFRIKIRWSSWDAFTNDASASARPDPKGGSAVSYEQALLNDLVMDRKDTVIQEDAYGTGS